MKKLILFFVMCILFNYYLWRQCVPLHIDSKILATVDGHPRLLKVMADLVSFKHKIEGILSREMPTKRIPQCTFKRIVSLEDELLPKERDTILHKFLHQFSQIPEIEIFGALNLPSNVVATIIECWKEQRNRPDSLLFMITTKEYKTNHEHMFRQYITSLNKFDQFLEDLHQFADDLMYSLPKSSHLYQELKHKVHEQHESTAIAG